MNRLEKIQKAFGVFKILTRIAFIFCVVGASICAVAALCVAICQSGGQALSLFGQPFITDVTAEELRELCPILLSESFIIAAEAIILAFALTYYKTEQADGTPFSENGADQLKKLGIKCIYIPIVAIVISSVILACFNVDRELDISCLPNVVTGVLLILVSQIFKYGAELEEKVREK